MNHKVTWLGGMAGVLAIGAVLITMPTSETQAQGTWTGSSSAEDLRYRLDILDAELADIRARLGGSVASVAPSSGGGGVDASRLNGLEAEIRRLTAAVEEMQNAQRRVATDAANRFADIEFRLTELEGGDTSNVGQVQPLGGGQQTVGAGGQTPAFGTGGAQVAAVSVSEQGDLDRAALDVQQGRFDQGEDRLRRFLSQYQGSPLTGDAYFWLGESQSVRGNNTDAARSYLSGYNADRIGRRAPHNLYRLGVTLGRLGQLNEACLTLREVRTQFPDAPDGLVRKADAEADNLTCG